MDAFDFSRQRYALRLEWDGSDFAGWQLQNEGPGYQGIVTIQSVLEKALATALRRHGERFPVDGCGRLDSGVHAEEFFAHADLPKELGCDDEAFRHRINCLLPKSVAVTFFGKVDLKWHARKSSVGKVYSYRVLLRRAKPTLHAGRVLWMPLDPSSDEFFDRTRLKECLKLFEGERDFVAFAAANLTAKTTVRTLDRVELIESPLGDCASDGLLLKIEFHGRGFLKQMVRNLVGTALEVAKGRRSMESVKSLLGIGSGGPGKRLEAGFCAEAQGLFLAKVLYGPDDPIHHRN